MTKPAVHNGFDPDQVKRFTDRILSLEQDLDSEKGSYMQACKQIREDIKDIFTEAKSQGLPVKALRTAMKRHKITADYEALRDELEGEDQDNLDLLEHALGWLKDTPLGEAAMESAKKRQDAKGAAVDSLTDMN